MQKKRGECMRLVSINVNGIGDEEKRRVMTENFANGRVDVLGVSEMHIRGTGVSDGREGMWEGVPGGVGWIRIEAGVRKDVQ